MLSAAGSRLATENVPNAGQVVPIMADRMRQSTESWRKHGFDVEMTDLWYGGDRHDIGRLPGQPRLEVSATDAAELVAVTGFRSRRPAMTKPKLRRNQLRERDPGQPAASGQRRERNVSHADYCGTAQP